MSEQAGFREFLQTPTGRAGSIGLVVVALAAVAWSVWSNVRKDPTIAAIDAPWFVNVDTGKGFHQPLTAGMTFPVKCPDTGAMSGYPAELCYWTKDGKVKKDPTFVALNDYTGKPGPTFCPDCGRLVVVHNPFPGPGVNPPPTREQYLAMHGGADMR